MKKPFRNAFKRSFTNIQPRALSMLLLLSITVTFIRCAKEVMEPTAANPLSKTSGDYQKRIAAIKTAFYQNGLDLKLTPNKSSNLIWNPDWEHSSVQVINDSISYVFFKLIPKINVKGKLYEAKEGGGASYLVVKNEKEFFKGLYRQTGIKVDRNAEPTELSVTNFTGDLLLVNLKTERAFVVQYENGTFSDMYVKKIASMNKTMSANPSLPLLQNNCHIEYFGCTFYTYTPNCGGQFWVILVDDCQWPNWCQNSVWILGDVQTREVCDGSWFPDPPQPIDPTNPGNPGNPGSAEYNANDFKIATTVNDRMPKVLDINKYTNCFSDGKIAQDYKLTIFVDQPVPNTNAQVLLTPPTYETDTQSGDRGILLRTTGGQFDVGHTFVSFEKINADGSTVRQTFGFYPDPDGFDAVSKGVIKADGGHGYEVSYEISVSDAQFFAAIQAMTEDSNLAVYKVWEYNCTDAALRWMNAAGAGLSSISRNLFSNTPGDFGQALRTNPNADSTGGYGPGGKGPCN